MSITVGQFRLTKTVGDMYGGEVIEAMNTIGGVTRTKLAGRNKSNVDQ